MKDTLELVRNKPKFFAICLVVIYIVGTIGFTIPFLRPLFTALVPLNLLLGVSLLVLFHSVYSKAFVLASALVAVLGFGVEVLGVNTGLIFGSYSYGEVLGIKLIKTPLLIGVNWFMLVYLCWDILGRTKLNVFFRITLSAALMLLYDWVMEPVAIKTGMWTWAMEDIPLQNYLAWYLIAVCMFSFLAILRLKFRNPLTITLFAVQFLFFSALGILL